MIALVLATVLPMAATYLLLQPAHRVGLPQVGIVGLAVGLGLGIASCLFFLALLFFDGSRGSVMAIDGLLLVVALGVWWYWRRPSSLRSPTPLAGRESLLLAIVIAAAGAAALSFLANYLDSPHGRWDAWATWNIRARWLATAGPTWRESLQPPLIHGDYPLLLPTTVARLWVYAGDTPTAAPAAVAAALAVALVLILYAGLAALRGRVQALVAALCLLGTPLLLRLAPWQYADLPLAFYLLAALSLFALYDRDPDARRPLLLWAGVAAGLAAWTKNEGTMLVTGIVLVRGGLMLRRRQPDVRAAAWFAAGLLPPAALVFYFKHTLARPLTLYKQSLRQMLNLLLDPERYVTILRLGLYEVARGTLPVLMGIVLYAVLLGRTRDHRQRGMVTPIAAVLTFATFAYLLTYLTARSELTWLVPYSADRLALHLWPSALLGFFLYVASPAELAAAPQPAPAPRPQRGKASSRRR